MGRDDSSPLHPALTTHPIDAPTTTLCSPAQNLNNYTFFHHFFSDAVTLSELDTKQLTVHKLLFNKQKQHINNINKRSFHIFSSGFLFFVCTNLFVTTSSLDWHLINDIIASIVFDDTSTIPYRSWRRHILKTRSWCNNALLQQEIQKIV